jgi:hypothetical protein
MGLGAEPIGHLISQLETHERDGEFNWSSQHLDLEVLDGKKAAGCRSCAASEDAFAGQVGFPAAG